MAALRGAAVVSWAVSGSVELFQFASQLHVLALALASGIARGLMQSGVAQARGCDQRIATLQGVDGDLHRGFSWIKRAAQNNAARDADATRAVSATSEFRRQGSIEPSPEGAVKERRVWPVTKALPHRGLQRTINGFGMAWQDETCGSSK